MIHQTLSLQKYWKLFPATLRNRYIESAALSYRENYLPSVLLKRSLVMFVKVVGVSENALNKPKKAKF